MKTKGQSQKEQKDAIETGNVCFNARKDHKDQQKQLLAEMH